MKNDDFSKKVLPFLKTDYFQNIDEKILFNKINDYINKYNSLPDILTLKVEIDTLTNINQTVIDKCSELLDEFEIIKTVEKTDWLLDNTEEFCKQKSLYLAMSESLEIMNSKKGLFTLGAIPQKISDALAVSFDPNVGHDYMLQSDDRYAAMHHKDAKIQFDLDLFNKITDGGVSIKTLNMLMAPPGVGKTMFLCHFAAANLLMGKNVLYITLEMSEEKIAERIDANLLNIDMDILKQIPKLDYDKRINLLKQKTNGKLIIKEYPTTSASVVHFRALLNELYLKKSFKPDVIYVDYLNICASSRLKPESGSYSFVKAIAEELRGLGVEFKIPIWSATQTNRGGMGNSELDMSDLSESIGTGMTVDLLLAIFSNEELEKLNQMMVTQLKNRYGDVNTYKKFLIGVDRPKMKLYNLTNSAQSGIMGNPSSNTVQNLNTLKFRTQGLKV